MVSDGERILGLGDQWEDFAGSNAARLLKKYRDRLSTVLVAFTSDRTNNYCAGATIRSWMVEEPSLSMSMSKTLPSETWTVAE